jgi:hypothetical protein
MAQNFDERLNDIRDEPVRWNNWSRVYPVQFEDEQVSRPRGVRLACAAMRKGDPVQIIEGLQTTTGVIAGIISSVVHVTTTHTILGERDR